METANEFLKRRGRRARGGAGYLQDGAASQCRARAIAFAIEQPDDVDINEIVLRPTAQTF